MKDVGIITGSKDQAIPVVIGYDTVYVHSDIHELELSDNSNYTIWQYHEVQYTKDEYIDKITEEKSVLEKQTTDLQLALIDLYESTITE